MDDLYAINFAKTEFREAFNTGNPERLIALLDPEFVYMPDGLGQTMGAGAADTIRMQFRELTGRYYVQLHPIIIEIRIQDSVAYDYGWHIWKKTPRDGSPQITAKDRYVDIWRKNEKGEWKLWMYMNNADIPMQLTMLRRSMLASLHHNCLRLITNLPPLPSEASHRRFFHFLSAL